jgi:membrane fusion protein (multidrug efflux system)
MKLSRGWVGSSFLLLTVLGAGVGLAAWKAASIHAAEAEAANQPEPMEAVTAAVAGRVVHRRSTTSIGTVVALRSITLRNELPGTVRHVALAPGRVVPAGKVLVALDVSVEEADLKALEAQAALAGTLLARLEAARQSRAVSDTEVDRARAERDVALAQIERIRAIIERKTLRAPFPVRVGISDVHPGQYLEEGTLLTTLQGIDRIAYVDFTVAERVAAGLRAGDVVEILPATGGGPIAAELVAIDARVDPATRNAAVRARIRAGEDGPAPGASVRVRVGIGEAIRASAVPVSALRSGPAGDHVFVLDADEAGVTRAHLRRVVSGPVLGDTVVIEEGLTAGETVAASGSFKLFDGAAVAVDVAPVATGGAPAAVDSGAVAGNPAPDARDGTPAALAGAGR